MQANEMALSRMESCDTMMASMGGYNASNSRDLVGLGKKFNPKSPEGRIRALDTLPWIHSNVTATVTDPATG